MVELKINPVAKPRMIYSNVMKATNEQLIESYNRLNNIWKVAEEFSMCGQTVWGRLKKLGIKLNNPYFSEEEINRVKEVYESGIIRGDGKLQALSKELGRTIPLISRTAGKLKLTTYNRECDTEIKNNISIRTKKWHNENEHPKGFLNHKHSEKSLEKISKSSKDVWKKMTNEELLERQRKTYNTSIKNGTYYKPHLKTTWKQQWATIAEGKTFYFRSQWEVNYAKFLQFLKEHKDIKDWEFEPDTFWFETIQRGVRSYLPDFKVFENNGDIIYYEVKGWMDDKSKTKLKRMKKYYPKIKLKLIQSHQYNEILKKFSFLFK